MSLSDSTTMIQSTIEQVNTNTKTKTKNSRKPKTKNTDTDTDTDTNVAIAVDTTTVEKEKVVKPKVPSLSGKYAKFMQFGFWFANQIAADELSRDTLLKSLKIYDSVEVQTHFYKSFEDEAKTVAKTLRVNIADAKKQVKLAEKAALKAEKKAVKMAEKPPKTPRAKKNKNIVDAPTDVISQIVALAQSNEPIVPTSEIPSTESSLVQETAPKEKPKKNTKKTTADTDTATKEKPKRVYKKKNATPEPEPTPTPNLNNDDDDLDVDIVDIDGKQFLVDSDKNLYDFHTHLPLNRKL